MNYLNELQRKAAFSTKHRAGFYQEIADALAKDIPLHAAIKAKREFYIKHSKKRDHPMAKILGQVLDMQEDGKQLGFALNKLKLISPLEAAMLTSSEESGKLKEGLLSVTNLVTGANKMKGEIQASLVYPIVLTAILIVVYIIHVYQVLPSFAEVIELDEWKGMAALYRDICLFIIDYGLITTILFSGLIIHGFKTLPDKPATLRRRLDNHPPHLFYRVYQASGFLMAVAVMMQANVKIDEAIEKIQKFSSPWLKSKIIPIRKKIAEGKEPSQAFVESDLFPDKPDDIKAKLFMYGEMGDFERAARELAKTVLDDAVDITRRIGNQIRNFMFVFAGVGMLITYFGVSSIGDQIYEMFKNIQ